MNYTEAFNSISGSGAPITQYTRGYSTNNIYAGVPPIMADGRSVIASYQPEAIQNDILLKESGVKSNWEYRMYLTRNAKELMARNFEQAANDVGYIDDRAGMIQRPVLNSANDQSDLKQLYLSEEVLAERFQPRALTQEELLFMDSRR